ncbi:uncharacterized protein [Amphiura filiformis]|uniref:uncharacterized protein n=1 Tax=Amphiura filiformis TaxID=82378 RepID=UPI003B216BE8
MRINGRSKEGHCVRAYPKPAVGRSSWLYSKANWDAVNSKLATYRFDDSVNVDTAWDNFLKFFMETMSECIPQKFVRCKSKDPPWLNSDLRCSPGEIVKLISKLNNNSAAGVDGITAVMLKNTAVSVSPILCKIFNLSISTGVTPSAWKLSRVIPIFKSGDRHSVTNYRPISLQPIVCKTLERVIHKHILTHLNLNKVLTNQQFGFLPKSSTADALLTALNDCSLVLYADDTTLFKPISNDSAITSFQADIDTIHHWFSKNNLTANASKTRLMVISTKKDPFPNMSLYMNNQVIDRVSSVKFLGIHISDNLSWNEHVNFISKKARKTIGYIHRAFNCASPTIRRLLYLALVQPILEYGSITFHPLNVTLTNRLEP